LERNSADRWGLSWAARRADLWVSLLAENWVVELVNSRAAWLGLAMVDSKAVLKEQKRAAPRVAYWVLTMAARLGVLWAVH
jgi:hypothetical protein